MGSDDVKLVRRLQRGDPAAFADFLDQFGGRVHALSRRYARGEADAEDLTQEIFVALHRSLPSFRGDAALSTYVYRVALNHCLKYQARRKPEGVPIDDLPLAASENDGPERHVARHELAAAVEQALGTLSDDHRQVVLLHELQGLTYVECAAVLGIPVGTVKSRLSNAFKRLRVRLETYVNPDSTEDCHAPVQQPA